MQNSLMCESCDGLCCRVYDIIDQKNGNLIKKSGVKCVYLADNNKCRIHNKWSGHAGYVDSCAVYDCMEGGPIVTIFARRIANTNPIRSAIISSLLETIRIRILENPESRKDILNYTAGLLMHIRIDESLMLSVKVARVKIENWKSIA